MPDYQNGRIYLIRGGDEVYYGSTTQSLSKRMAKHRWEYKNERATCKSSFLFLTYGVENCVIELVELFPCTSCEELNAREGHWIRNNPCVNRCIAGRTHAEYRAENKEKAAEYSVKYRNANKEKLSEKKAEYRKANKEKIAEKKAEWRKANKEKIAEKKAEWRRAKKENINQTAELPHAAQTAL